MTALLKGALEDNVLTVLCWSHTHAPEVALKVAPDLFSTRNYVLIAEAAHGFLTRYNEPPRTHLRDLLEDKLHKGDEGRLLERTIAAMEALQVDYKPEYVIEELDTFIQLRELSLAVENAATALEKGNLSEARDALYVPATAVASTGTWLHDAKRALRYFDNKDEDYFSCGISALDERAVRPKRKGLFLFLGPKGAGKSWFLVNTGKANLIRRKKVLHITLEMPEEEVALRYAMAMFALSEGKAATVRVPTFRQDAHGSTTSIAFEDITGEELSANTRADVGKKLRALKKRSWLLIKEFPTGSLTIAQLSAYLDSLKASDNFVPDLLIIDYPQLMKLDTADIRGSLGRTIIAIRGLCMARNMAGVAVAQGNRESMDAKTVRATHMSEDISGVMTADYVITQSRTKHEQRLNLARVGVEKARGAKDGWSALISQAYEIGQYAIDSLYMDKQLFGEVDRVVSTDE